MIRPATADDIGALVAMARRFHAGSQYSKWSLFDGGYTFATKIASAASEFNDHFKAGAYIAAGLVLFVLTFVVNALARAAVSGKGRG